MYNRQSRALPDETTIYDHFRTVVPFSRSNPDDVADIRAWGQSRALPAGRTEAVAPGPGGAPGRRVVVQGPDGHPYGPGSSPGQFG